MHLLVSVRSADEAEIALSGGAQLIDVKEPDRGPLGRADESVIQAVVRQVAGRVPVSAALGELSRSEPRLCVRGLTYVKWGLAGWGTDDGWQTLLAARHVCCQPVAAAYADWQRAAAPPVDAVVGFVLQQRWPVLLIDTWGKDGSTLLDWMSREHLAAVLDRCRTAGVRVALAGSLNGSHIASLRALGPDWWAVRGAVCRDGRRAASLDAAAVRCLADLIHGPSLPLGAPGS